MWTMIRLVTGGARSGKSTYAERLFEDRDDVLYMATARVEDKEMEDRVHLHQVRRPKTWGLYEGDRDLAFQVGSNHSAYLLDCVTVLISNYLFDMTGEADKVDQETMQEVEEAVLKELTALVDKARDQKKSLTLVTNEIGDGPVPMSSLVRAFRDIQGRVNQALARQADEVYLVVCGIPVKVK